LLYTLYVNDLKVFKYRWLDSFHHLSLPTCGGVETQKKKPATSGLLVLTDEKDQFNFRRRAVRLVSEARRRRK
jgi:hypothetical protein